MAAYYIADADPLKSTRAIDRQASSKIQAHIRTFNSKKYTETPSLPYTKQVWHYQWWMGFGNETTKNAFLLLMINLVMTISHSHFMVPTTSFIFQVRTAWSVNVTGTKILFEPWFVLIIICPKRRLLTNSANSPADTIFKVQSILIHLLIIPIVFY